jgi:putative protease
MFDKRIQPLPELLCPAGSPEALDAAIEGGADAVYLGGTAFNARMNAHNFGGDALRSAVLRAHSYGVKVYLTLNTLVNDREIPAALSAAEEAANAGVDALIVADLGLAAALHRAFPTLELHASTQASSHNSLSAEELKKIGFSRIVVARETPAADLFETVKNSPLEIEMFIHGALCVSHSGQCLFSSLVGGRSGNRGECAQPCRLPFACKKGGNAYPLSLKDLSLAAHVPALIESGVASLKIEGRMKAPEYVRDTARIWRRLLDERRAATPDEMRELASIFSRGGFTDGYYKEKIDGKMLGIRSEDDKSASRTLTPFAGITRKIPLDFAVRMRENEPIALTISDKNRRISVTGDIPQVALTAPLTNEHLERNLSKLGGTPYSVGSFTVEMDDGLMLPVSRLNDLRRRAIAEWEIDLAPQKVEKLTYVAQNPQEKKTSMRSARFYSPEQITPLAREFFDRIYLPLGKETAETDGVVLPPVIFERDLKVIEPMLSTAAAKGVRYALVGNIGHIEIVKRAGLLPVGDFRLNVTNCESVCVLEEMGISSLILSPELTLPQARDIKGDTSLIVYGRIPLMTVEKCVIKEIADCDTCAKNSAILTDRRGVRFPVLREWEHRNVIYNSLPTSMADRQDGLTKAGIVSQHFIFSTETLDGVDEIIHSWKKGEALPYPVRRI